MFRVLALAAALALAACTPSPPQPKQTPVEKSEKTEKSEKAAPKPETPADASTHAACEAARPAIEALRGQASDAAIAYAGSPLQTWIVANDRDTGRKDDAAILAALADTTPAGHAFARGTIEGAIAQWMRHQLKLAAEGKEAREVAWFAAKCAWDVALVPLAQKAQELGLDASPALEVQAAFAAGEVEFAEEKATDAEKDRVVLPNRQTIEKTWYRVAQRLLLHAAGEARKSGDPAAASAARAYFEMLRDRMPEKNTPGIAVVTTMLAGDPKKIDPEAIEREVAVALVKRARKYCSEPVDPAAGKALGSPDAIAAATEGAVYTRLLLPDMDDKLAARGFDRVAHLRAWDAFVEAVADADADEAKKLSAELVQWNCQYQEALGVRECTATVDEIKK